MIMKKVLALILSGSLHMAGWSQVVNTATMDTTDFRYQGKVTIEGYLNITSDENGKTRILLNQIFNFCV